LVRSESVVRLLGNRLVLVTSGDSGFADAEGPIGDVLGQIGDGHLAMANVDAVPAGKYGKAALESLGLWDRVAGRVAQAQNVRVALALVSTGEAPLGIVYRTDAVADPVVKVIATFPETSHPPIVYPAALTAEARGADAGDFLAFLQTPEAAALFEAQGFVVLAHGD
jgi:molybdate transport system substrate-binding protein